MGTFLGLYHRMKLLKGVLILLLFKGSELHPYTTFKFTPESIKFNNFPKLKTE